MVRVDQLPETVQLIVSGPKSILRETTTVDARLNHSWYELLRGELGLEIDPDSGTFLCTSNYRPTAPKDGEGWRAELRDEIRDYITKFARKMRQYSVRICKPEHVASSIWSNLNVTPPLQRHPSIVIPTQGQGLAAVVPPTPPINYEQPGTSRNAMNVGGARRKGSGTRGIKRNHQQTLEEIKLGASGQVIGYRVKYVRFEDPIESPSQQRQCRAARRRNARDGVPRIDRVSSLADIKLDPDSEEAEEEEHEVADGGNSATWDQKGWDDAEGEPPVNENADADDVEDDASMCTAATAEETELRKEGIQVEDVKTLAEARISRFGNGFMLRVRSEIQKLQGNHLWDRNVNRAPLACYLLQEIFKM